MTKCDAEDKNPYTDEQWFACPNPAEVTITRMDASVNLCRRHHFSVAQLLIKNNIPFTALKIADLDEAHPN